MKQGLGGACSHLLKGQWSVTHMLAAGGADTRLKAQQPLAPGALPAQPYDGGQRVRPGPHREPWAERQLS